jgi:hypothetical protein
LVDPGLPWLDSLADHDAVLNGFRAGGPFNIGMSPAGPLDVAEMLDALGRAREARVVLEEYVSEPVNKSHVYYLRDYLRASVTMTWCCGFSTAMRTAHRLRSCVVNEKPPDHAALRAEPRPAAPRASESSPAATPDYLMQPTSRVVSLYLLVAGTLTLKQEFLEPLIWILTAPPGFADLPRV